MASIVAVCRSDKKGVSKSPIEEGFFREDYGLVDDAHASSRTHRQVSLLAVSSIDKMRSLGLDLDAGDFAENLTIEGLGPDNLPIGTRLSIGQGVILEVSQIGKECHSGCAIMRQVGKCIMPTEGIFARVIKGGLIKAGDDLEIIEEGD